MRERLKLVLLLNSLVALLGREINSATDLICLNCGFYLVCTGELLESAFHLAMTSDITVHAIQTLKYEP